MIYEYKCSSCGQHADRACKVDERDTPFVCEGCKTDMERIPSFNGGLKTEHPAWLGKGTNEALSDGSVNITTRTEHDNYCKQRGIAHL